MNKNNITRIQIITPCTTPDSQDSQDSKDSKDKQDENKKVDIKFIIPPNIPTPTNSPCLSELDLLKDLVNTDLKIKFETNNIDL